MVATTITHLPLETEVYSPIVSRVMRIDDITLGDSKSNYLVRYRGELYGDSEDAYDELATQLRSQDVTPLFRKENDQHVVLLMAGTIRPKPANPVVNLVMFGLTVLSVIFAGALFAYNGPTPSTSGELLSSILGSLGPGLAFAVSLLAILLAHEFGHYLAGRYHNTYVTLPYFIPFPFSPFGTMGAFIQLKEPPRNRRVLLDIGIAGPLAGLVVAIPVLLIGLSLSRVEPINVLHGQGFMLEGNSIIYLMAKYMVFGRWLPEPVNFGGLSPMLYWLKYFFTGQPLPIGGLDVMIHPVAWAGWAGLLVTALNLIPAGQLDGGHVLYVLLGKRVQALLPFILAGLVALGFVWSGWWLWAALVFLLGRFHAEPLDQITTLDPVRRAIAWFGIVLFILVFIPVPLIQFMGG